MSYHEVIESIEHSSYESRSSTGVNQVRPCVFFTCVEDLHRKAFKRNLSVDKLTHTLVSDTWRLYRVPADQVEPLNSDWRQISSMPGIHIVGRTYGTYRIGITQSYLPWLSEFKLEFELEDDLLMPVEGEISVYGIRQAREKACSRFGVIRSAPPGLV